MNTIDRTINLLDTACREASRGYTAIIPGWPDLRRPETIAPLRRLTLANVERMATRCLARGVPQCLVNETLMVADVLRLPYAAVIDALDSLPPCA